MATDLATRADVEARLGRSLSTAEQARIDALLSDASAAVRGYTGQTLTAASSTATLPIVGGRVSLPQRPVQSVERVVVDWAVLVDVDVVGSSIRGLYGCSAVVTYAHGYPEGELPAQIVSVVCAMVLRSLGVSPIGVGKTSESIGDYSYRLSASTLARRPVVDATDRADLDRFRIPQVGAFWLG